MCRCQEEVVVGVGLELLEQSAAGSRGVGVLHVHLAHYEVGVVLSADGAPDLQLLHAALDRVRELVLLEEVLGHGMRVRAEGAADGQAGEEGADRDWAALPVVCRSDRGVRFVECHQSRRAQVLPHVAGEAVVHEVVDVSADSCGAPTVGRGTRP